MRRKSIMTSKISAEFCICRLLLPLIMLFIVPFFLLSNILSAQTPEWVYQYVNPDFSEVSCTIAVDSLGNSYTTGYIGIGPSGGLGIIKLNSTGDEIWIYCNDTLGAGAYGQDIVVDDEKIYVAGYSQSISGNKDLLVTCVDTSGQAQWIYRDTVALEANAIALSLSNMIYVAGFTYINSFDIFVMKFDTLGNEKWRYVYDGPAASYDEATDISIDSEENIYIGGYSTGIGTSTDFTVIKLDSAGNEKWVYRYDGPANYRDELKAIALDTLSNIYMTGWSWGIDWDFCVVKIDSSGQEQWVYRYGGSGNNGDFAEDIIVDDTGFAYICGTPIEVDLIPRFTVTKLDSAGVEQWMYQDIGLLGNGGGANCIVLDGFSHLYAGGGFINSSFQGQIAVVKLNSSGDSLWTYVFPHQPVGSNSDVSRDIVADFNGNIYLLGEVAMAQFDKDIVVFKFPSQNQIKTMKHQKTISNDFMSTIFRGKITITSNNAGLLTIHDVIGRKILQQAITPACNLHIKLQPGVYFLQIEGGQYPVTKKKIIVL